jgi:hypothetical protein
MQCRRVRRSTVFSQYVIFFNQRQRKIPLVLGLVILDAMLENNLLCQSTCSENDSLKTKGQHIQNVGPFLQDGTMHHKATVALCNVPTCLGMNGLSRLLPERLKVQ